MKRMATQAATILITALAVLFTGGPAHANPAACKAFVDSPTVETYMQCSSSIGQSLNGVAEGKYRGKNSPAASEL